LFIGNEQPVQEKIQPISNGDGRSSIFVKPIGGLWTSTWDTERQTSAWVEWCGGDNYGEPYKTQWWLLTPKTGIRIAVIDSLADLLVLLRRYPRQIDERLSFLRTRYLDYERMSQDYDALYLTEEGQGQTHLSIQADLYGWD